MQCLAGSSCVQVAGHHCSNILQKPERTLQPAAGNWHYRLALLWSYTRSATHLTYACPLQWRSDHACMSALTAKIQAVHTKCQTSEADLTISVALPCRPINQQGLSGLLLHTRGCSPCSCSVWPSLDFQADYSKGSLAQDCRAVTRCVEADCAIHSCTSPGTTCGEGSQSKAWCYTRTAAC